MFYINEVSVIAQFRAFMTSIGIEPHGDIEINPDGKIHRFCVEGDRAGSKNGAYCLHIDNRPAGFVQDWRKDITANFRYELSTDEKKEFATENSNPERKKERAKEREEAERRKAEEKIRQIEIEQDTRSRALLEYLYSDLFGIFKHSYLKNRFTLKEIIFLENCGIFDSFDVQTENTNQTAIQRLPIGYCMGSINGVCKAGEILIPMRHAETRDFQTLIHIPPEPDNEGHFVKYNYKGLSPKGACHFLEPRGSMNADYLYVTEGICTGIAVILLTEARYPVYSCGSCNNLLSVCEGLKKRNSNKKIIIMADNDKNNQGVIHARSCLNKGVADLFKAPPLIGDWHDFLTKSRKEG